MPGINISDPSSNYYSWGGPGGQVSTGWSAEQLANARLIVSVGLQMGMSSRDIIIGLMTAMQESSLMNLSGAQSDPGSYGLFQQRPDSGWGSPDQVMNPMYSTQKFFEALRGIGNRGGMALGDAAQAVQRSAFPGAYAKWENAATGLLNSLGINSGIQFPVQTQPTNLAGITSQPGQNSAAAAIQDTGQTPGTQASTKTTPGVQAATEDKISPSASGSTATTAAISTPTQPASDPQNQFKALMGLLGGGQGSGARGSIVNAARQWLGTPYLWGGGDSNGPTGGYGHGSTYVTGFDCSGLVLYALSQAGLHNIPRIAADQLSMGIGQNVGQNQGALQPGDLIGMEGGGHIGIYIGGGQFIEAPHTGDFVKISNLSGRSDWWGVHLNIGGSGGTGGTDPNSAAGLAAPTTPTYSYPGISS